MTKKQKQALMARLGRLPHLNEKGRKLAAQIYSDTPEMLLGDNELLINAPIVDDMDGEFMLEYWGEQYVYPKYVRARLNELMEAGAEEIVVKINSAGGNVFAATEIQGMLHEAVNGDNPVKIRMEVVGMAFSAAAQLTLISEDVTMQENAQLMFHNAHLFSYIVGNADDIEKDVKSALQVLRNVDSAATKKFAEKTGLTQAEAQEIYNAETYYSAQQALELGLANEVKQLTTDPDNDSDNPEQKQKAKPEAKAKDFGAVATAMTSVGLRLSGQRSKRISRG